MGYNTHQSQAWQQIMIDEWFQYAILGHQHVDYQPGDEILILADNPTTQHGHGIGLLIITSVHTNGTKNNLMQTSYWGANQYLPSPTISALNLLIVGKSLKSHYPWPLLGYSDWTYICFIWELESSDGWNRVRISFLAQLAYLLIPPIKISTRYFNKPTSLNRSMCST